MDQLPVLEPVAQFAGFEQKIRIVRMAVSSLFAGKSFINQDPGLPDCLSNTGYQGTVEIAEDQDAPVGFLFKGVYIGFQIDLPETSLEAFLFRGGFGLIQGLRRSVGQDDRKTQSGQKQAVFPLAASQIQNRNEFYPLDPRRNPPWIKKVSPARASFR